MLPLGALVLQETLPSWPAVHSPTALEMIFLTLLLPLGIALVLAAVILGPGWRQKDEG